MLMHVLYKKFNSCQMMFPACGVNVSILVNVDELFEKYRAQHEQCDDDDDDVPFARLEKHSLTFYVLRIESFLYSELSALRKTEHHIPKMRKKNGKLSKTSSGSISSVSEEIYFSDIVFGCRKKVPFRFCLSS